MREIYTVLRQASQQGQVVLEQRWAARFSDLQSALFKFKPTLIHFSGHGQSNGELVFENSIGMHHLVNARALSSLLKLFSNQVKCILLNANYSQIQAKEIVNFIDYSIGFSQETSEKACIAFSRGFYRALGEGVSLEEAYQLGCVELHDYDILEDQFPIFNRRN